MQKKISNLPFKGTAAQAEALKKVIDANKHDKSRLMGVMQEAQGIYGYLPGVATFYAQFALSPKGNYNISVCLGTACYVKGSGDVFNKIQEILGIGADECTPDGRFSLTACRCIGACGLAPVLTINDEVFGRLTADDVPNILKKYGA